MGVSMTACKIFMLLFIFNNRNTEGRIFVETKAGKIQGVMSSNGDYNMFLGIPYAKVNESNPFGLSKPYPRFDGIFNATDDSALCPQITENNELRGTLDCLHLHIYVPSSPSKEYLPVLVMIHGGGLNFGNAGRYELDPKYLMRHDIIFVSINYRLGIYGFMCLGTPEVPGNQGLKDQQLALHWIKDNIESFGGDVDQITLYGHSAGGAAVDYHVAYGEEGLFHRIILGSGSSFVPIGLAEPDVETPRRIAEYLGYKASNISDLLDFLAQEHPLLVKEASVHYNEFTPCIERSEENNRFISEYPVNVKVPLAKNKSVLTGLAANEILYQYATVESEYFKKSNEINERLTKSFDFDIEYLKEMEDIVRHFYLGDGTENEQLKFNFIEFMSDIQFNYPVIRTMYKYMEHGAKKVFFYLFSYFGKRNTCSIKNNSSKAVATHCDELGYLFDASYQEEAVRSEDQVVIDSMTTIWTNFVKYGDPTLLTSDVLPVNWEPITNRSIFPYMKIDSELTMKTRPFQRRMAFMDLFYEMNAKFEKGVH